MTWQNRELFFLRSVANDHVVTRKSTCFASRGSQVRTLSRPPNSQQKQRFSEKHRLRPDPVSPQCHAVGDVLRWITGKATCWWHQTRTGKVPVAVLCAQLICLCEETGSTRNEGSSSGCRSAC